jgi:dTDP-4-amino-4,6-dideoxygalactose transaminase
MNNNETLALLGGKPVRSKIFKSQPMTDSKEIELVSELIKNKQFSKFVGSPISGTYEQLAIKSRDLSTDKVPANFLGGQYVRKLEKDWAQITNTDYAISVNSATSGLTTALLALNLDPGSEVITTPFSFTATCAAIIAANCIPIFCDIDPDTFCLSPIALKEIITKKTKCVVTVHWCGNVGDLNQIQQICKENNVFLVEDAAQAPTSVYHGKPVGSYGNIAVFSFNEPKNIMTGEGGMIVTNDQDTAKKCRLIRNHGEAILNEDSTDNELINIIGYNFRLTEIHAAIAYVQTCKRKKINKIRKDNYLYLSSKLKEEFSDHIIPQKVTHLDSYYAYTAAFRWNSSFTGLHRNIVVDALISEGIPVFKGYHRLMCDHPMFKRKIAFGSRNFPWTNSSVNYQDLKLPNARNLVENQFIGFLQMGYPNTKNDMDDIISAFTKIITNSSSLLNIKSESINLDIGR